jgi:hypothetical protein
MGEPSKKRVDFVTLYHQVNLLVGDEKRSKSGFLETKKDGSPIAYISNEALSAIATASEIRELKKQTVGVLANLPVAIKFKDRKVANAFQIDVRTLAALAQQQENEESTIFRLERELSTSRSQVLQLQHKTNEYEVKLKSLLSQSSQKSEFVRAAEKISKDFTQPAFKSEVDAATKPYLFVMLSDWHVGEVVKKPDTLGLNSFDKATFLRRIRVLLDEIRTQAFGDHAGSAEDMEFPYAGLVLPLGGDFISGVDHPDLERTNELEVAESKNLAATVLSVIVSEMAELFPEVYVPCVVGNHGKISRFNSRDEAANRYDTEVYQEMMQLVERNLGIANNVKFDVFSGGEGTFSVNGRKYLLTHGNNLLAGDKTNFKTAVIKGAEKLHENLVKYDMLLVGHFHQYTVLDNIVINGSVKGFDYFAKSLNLKPQAPTQAMWVDHPVKGVIRHAALVLDKVGGVKVSRGVKRGDVTLVKVTESHLASRVAKATKALKLRVA